MALNRLLDQWDTTIPLTYVISDGESAQIKKIKISLEVCLHVKRQSVVSERQREKLVFSVFGFFLTFLLLSLVAFFPLKI